MTQLLVGLTGLLLVHWVTITNYAEYTFAFSLTATVTQLSDLGWVDAMLGVIGEWADDPAVIGGLMRAAMSLRWAFFAVIMPSTALAFFALTSHRGWPLPTDVLMFASVAVALIARVYLDYYVIPLVLAKRFVPLYSANAGASLARVGNLLLKLSATLSGAAAVVTNTLGFVLNSIGVWAPARKAVIIPRKVDPAYRSAILRVALPTLPAQIFFSLQGQITIFIIAIVGSNASLASLGALSRLAPGFSILTSVAAYVLVPHVARAPQGRVNREVAWSMGAILVVVAVLTVVGFAYPQAYLFVLGDRYAHLTRACSWFICASRIGTVSACLGAMTIARRYTWWWASLGQVVIVVTGEILGAMLFRLSDLVQLQFWTLGWRVPWRLCADLAVLVRTPLRPGS